MARPMGISDKEYYEKYTSEIDFLKWYAQQERPFYPQPSVTADMVVYSLVEGRIKLLVIRRATHPDRHKLSLVGGFVLYGEDAYQTCQREIKREVGLELPSQHIEQLMTISTPDRDPRGWVMMIAHLVYLPSLALQQVHVGEDGREPLLLDVDFQERVCRYDGRILDANDFAFDHYQVIQTSMKRIQGRLNWNPTFLHLLNSPFTIYDATNLVNLISPNKKIISNNFLSKYGTYIEEVGLERHPKKKPRKTYRLKNGVG